MDSSPDSSSFSSLKIGRFNFAIVKLRERKGQGIDSERSLKSLIDYRLSIIDINFPEAFILNLVATHHLPSTRTSLNLQN